MHELCGVAVCDTVPSGADILPILNRPGYGGSLGGPRMQQQQLLGGGSTGAQGSRLGLPGAAPGSISGQRSQAASPLLSGLEEVRRELEAMQAIEGSPHGTARQPR